MSITTVLEPVTIGQARCELAKFLVIAKLASTAPGMFSQYIDAIWRHMAGTDPAAYAALCRHAVDHLVEHLPVNGAGAIAWIAQYHVLFGTLPPVWFADTGGNVDRNAYRRYLNTRKVDGRWNSTPVLVRSGVRLPGCSASRSGGHPRADRTPGCKQAGGRGHLEA